MRRPFILAFAAVLIGLCAEPISSQLYASYQVGEMSTTYRGVIKQVREVRVEPGGRSENNGLGIAGGGIAGGVLGGVLGKGRFVPTAVGAIAGAVTGSFIEKKMARQPGFEYIVELDNGSLITVMQGPDALFSVGQPVYVTISPSGRSRIVPR